MNLHQGEQTLAGQIGREQSTARTGKICQSRSKDFRHYSLRLSLGESKKGLPSDQVKSPTNRDFIRPKTKRSENRPPSIYLIPASCALRSKYTVLAFARMPNNSHSTRTKKMDSKNPHKRRQNIETVCPQAGLINSRIEHPSRIMVNSRTKHRDLRIEIVLPYK